MSYVRPEAIVEPVWLSKNLGDPNIVIIDASFHLPTANRDPKEEYLSSHIPGAVFFDINEIADQKVDLPHMLPNPCLLYTSPSPRDGLLSRMPSSA